MITAAIALLALPAALLLGAWYVALLDHIALAALGREALHGVLGGPVHAAAALLRQQSLRTEHPDVLTRALAPALYLALAAVGLALVPLGPSGALVDHEAGIVLWGAVEALVVVVVFLHGWSANSELALIGAYRYVAIGLPVMLLSMFVLIAAALPAQSLSLAAIVESQREQWNVLRQPLGLPLFLLLGLSLSLRGPFDYADPYDLAGGTSVEDSGATRAVWQLARLAMAVAFSGFASSAFLGGYLGPLLPGVAWLLLKSAGVLIVFVAAGHLLARLPPARMLGLLWTVLLPLAFADLLLAGVEALRR